MTTHRVRVKQNPSQEIEVDDRELLDLKRLDLLVADLGEKPAKAPAVADEKKRS